MSKNIGYSRNMTWPGGGYSPQSFTTGTYYIYSTSGQIEPGTTIAFSEEAFRHQIYEEQLSNIKLLVEDLRENLIRISERLDKTIVYDFDSVSNLQAKKMIESFLKEIKEKKPEISIFELSQKLKLPADQVEDILEGLSKEKKVRFKDGQNS